MTYLDHVRSDEADTTGPAIGWVVENVVDTESIVFLLQLLELVSEKNIIGVDVGEDEVDLGSVVTTVTGTIADDSFDDLQHGSDTSATSDHTNVTAHVGGVHHGTLRAADLQIVSDLEGGEVLRDVSLGVSLDEQVKVTSLVVGRNRSVGADNLLGLALDGGSERDVLTNGETENVGRAWQGKAIDGDIVRDLILLLEHEVLELGRVQDFARLCDQQSD